MSPVPLGRNSSSEALDVSGVRVAVKNKPNIKHGQTLQKDLEPY